MRTRTLSALGLLLLVAGCGGGSHPSNSVAIRAALAASPRTYLHYDAHTWGRNPHVSVRIHMDHDRATAVLSAPGTAQQRETLRLRGGTWSITSAGPGIINGPLASRSATTSELAAISAVAVRRLPQAVGCVTYGAAISAVDPRYARVDFIFPPSQRRHPHGRCGTFVGNGVDIYFHAASRWRHVVSGSQFYCRDAPPAVLRSLVGACGLR